MVTRRIERDLERGRRTWFSDYGRTPIECRESWWFPLEFFHVGIVVEDLHQGMSMLSSALGLGWKQPRDELAAFWFKGEPIGTRIQLCYSIEGPPFLELIQRTDSGPWTELGFNHIAYLVDDIETAGAALVEGGGAGLELERVVPAGEVPRTAYFILPNGLRLELVDRTR